MIIAIDTCICDIKDRNKEKSVEWNIYFLKDWVSFVSCNSLSDSLLTAEEDAVCC